MTKRVLVTGANGFTGSYLCRSLTEQGYQVRALVRPSSNTKMLHGVDVEYVRCDLARDDVPAKALRGVETVYHIAAVFRTEGVPDHYFYDVNVRGTERMLQAALHADVTRFVHCSTAGVMRKTSQPAADERTPYDPGDIYQHTKMEGECRALDFFHHHQLPGVVVRPASIYGPGDLRYLKLFRAIKKGVFVMIGPGTVSHHLIYIDDLVHGLHLAGEHPAAVGEIFILAGDQAVPIKQLVTMIAELLGRPAPKRHIPLRPVMLAAKVCQKLCRPLGIEPPLYPRRLDFFNKDRAYNISKAKHMLGYTPTTSLKTGLARTAQWYQQNGYLSSS